MVNELRKQYDVQEVTGDGVKKGDYDAIMVVQPSTLDNEKLDNLIAAIKVGIQQQFLKTRFPSFRWRDWAVMSQEEIINKVVVPGNPLPLHLKKETFQSFGAFLVYISMSTLWNS